MKPFLGLAIKLVKKTDKTGQVIKGLQSLKDSDVLVGIPQERSSRKGKEPITNAELAFIQSKGSPALNIPPRPFLEPSIDNNRAQIAIQQAAVIRSALEGKATISGLNKVGLMAQSVAKGWFTDPRNQWPPLSPRTIAAKKSDRPLIDTGQLRNAITYVIREKK